MSCVLQVCWLEGWCPPYIGKAGAPGEAPGHFGAPREAPSLIHHRIFDTWQLLGQVFLIKNFIDREDFPDDQPVLPKRPRRAEEPSIFCSALRYPEAVFPVLHQSKNPPARVNFTLLRQLLCASELMTLLGVFRRSGRDGAVCFSRFVPDWREQIPGMCCAGN